jgi:hypothetical protein
VTSGPHGKKKKKKQEIRATFLAFFYLLFCGGKSRSNAEKRLKSPKTLELEIINSIYSIFSPKLKDKIPICTG